jgi:hypothetical protein
MKIYQDQTLAKLKAVQLVNNIQTMILSTADITKQIESLKFTSISEDETMKLQEFLKGYIDLFATNPKKPTTTIATKHFIDTGSAKPIKQRAYRVSKKEEEIVKREVDEMLQNDIIRKSKSPWGAPVVLVTKPDGSIRFCIDYRKLNNITKKDVYPLPRIDETLEKMRGMKYYTSIDLASGYWQIELDEVSKEKTAFICHAGLFEFNVMPFGLCNAPATFQRMMDEIVGEAQVGLDYLDDVIVGSETFEQHIEDL